jgi:thioredoxin 1
MTMSTEVEEIKQRKMNEMMSKADSSESWPDAPVQVTDSNFEDFIKKYPKVVVDCWAPWCGPCRMLAPTIDQLARDMTGSVAFAKLNTDDNYGTSGKFRIASIPTLLIFKDGELVDKIVGAAPKSIIEQGIKKALG